VKQAKSFDIGHRTPSSIPLDPDTPLPIREWQQKYERYLVLIGKNETRKRYRRALERFLGKHPGKTYGHQFLRPVINSYVETRLAEGASVATVRLELSAVRGLFQFAMDMGASDVFFNPAKGVKVRQSKSGSAGTPRNEATTSPA
jgi:site-specific recombinase XerD